MTTTRKSKRPKKQQTSAKYAFFEERGCGEKRDSVKLSWADWTSKMSKELDKRASKESFVRGEGDEEKEAEIWLEEGRPVLLEER